MKVIIFTRHDDEGVSITRPTPEIFKIMQCGGYWSDRPRGFLETQIKRQVEAGIAVDHATRFAHAVQFGGLSSAEVYSVIRDRDCSRHGRTFDLIEPAELPDRWFRDAWTRKGSNSGLPYVDLELARPIQWKRIHSAVTRENKRRAADLFGKAPIRLNKSEYQNAIKHARDAEELRRIWAPSLPPS